MSSSGTLAEEEDKDIEAEEELSSAKTAGDSVNALVNRTAFTIFIKTPCNHFVHLVALS